MMNTLVFWLFFYVSRQRKHLGLLQNKKSASHAEKLGRESVKGAASARVGAKPSRCALLAPRQAPAQLLRSLVPPQAALPCSPLSRSITRPQATK